MIPKDAAENKTFDPNDIASVSDANSGITNTTGVYDDSDYPTPVFTINPTPEREPDHGHEYSEDDDEDNDYNYEYEKDEEVELSEEDTP